MKNYHAWLDISVGNIISQPMQRVLCQDFAKKINGKIIFELGEDVEFKAFNLQLRNMLKSKLKVKGFIFLRLEQLIINGKLNIELIKNILKKNYEIHFIRQNLSLTDLKDLKKNVDKKNIFREIKKNN